MRPPVFWRLIFRFEDGDAFDVVLIIIISGAAPPLSREGAERHTLSNMLNGRASPPDFPRKACWQTG